MKLFQKCLGVFSALALTCSAFAANEQCPTTGQLQSHFAAGSIPSVMPYPTTPTISDPTYEEYNNEWYVVTTTGVSLRGDATKFVGFVVFKDPSGGVNGPQYSNAQAISHARSIVSAITTEKSTDVDYPAFLIGTDGAGTEYHFDVCLYEGTFSETVGARGTTPASFATFPIVMADLSPGIGASQMHNELKKIIGSGI